MHFYVILQRVFLFLVRFRIIERLGCCILRADNTRLVNEYD